MRWSWKFYPPRSAAYPFLVLSCSALHIFICPLKYKRISKLCNIELIQFYIYFSHLLLPGTSFLVILDLTSHQDLVEVLQPKRFNPNIKKISWTKICLRYSEFCGWIEVGQTLHSDADFYSDADSYFDSLHVNVIAVDGCWSFVNKLSIFLLNLLWWVAIKRTKLGMWSEKDIYVYFQTTGCWGCEWNDVKMFTFYSDWGKTITITS